MVHVSMNSVLRYVKSDTTLRIDKIWYVFCKTKILSDFTLYGNVLMNSVPWYVKSDMTLRMLHTILLVLVSDSSLRKTIKVIQR